MKPKTLEEWMAYGGGFLLAILLIIVGYNWILSIIIGIALAFIFRYHLQKEKGGVNNNVEKERQGTTSTRSP